ncbi:hypothetical protein [Legionella gresilensis]|uniref:hypothetical protein n=1 Tax=Legionella gresilensis TaxID=91823 RepID=UPI001041BC08|nr:hypothetical protein [Legionella gresilensis]
MKKNFKPSVFLLENNPNSRGMHFFLKKKSFGIGEQTQSDRWSTCKKIQLTIFYDIADKAMLENNSSHGIFHSGFEWNILDEELKHLKITPKETIIIDVTLLIQYSPDTSLAVKIMSYPSVEVASALLVLGGFLALTTALITLIPPVGAAVAVSSASIALVGGILLTIGLTLALISRHCQNKVDNAPLKGEVNLSVEQLGRPDSRRSVSQQAKEVLMPQFFSAKKAESEISEVPTNIYSNN